MMKSLLSQPTNGSAMLGKIVEHKGIKSSLGPFRFLPDYTTVYPDVLISAMKRLYNEYNLAFVSLAKKNREWKKDYQYCITDECCPINWCVQIDMAGFSDLLLQEIADMPEETVYEILRKRIFEIENSVAMYQLLENLFSQDKQDSFFKIRFRAMLESLRRKFDKPIALLAVTESKHSAMREIEFGKRVDEQLTDTEIKELSGFDTFFGPKQFRDYLNINSGNCKHLLYVRSSDPLHKLRKPSLVVEHPLLSDIEMRRIIKAHALTFNVDAPDMEYVRRINDTKEYMVSMGLAFLIVAEKDLFSSEFKSYVQAEGIDPEAVATGKMMLRYKPAKGTYGCYGHVSGVLTDSKFRSKLRRNLRSRGHYIVQPEIATPIITNAMDGETYTFIDRNFFGMVDGCPKFLGGVRNLVPTKSTEAREGRIHGNSSAVYAEIVC